MIIGISIGDLNGIGSEVVLKTFEDTRMLELGTPVIFANVKLLSFLKRQYQLTLNLHGIDTLDQIVEGKINVLNLWKEPVSIEFGKTDEIVGKYAIKSFVAATKALQNYQIDVLVTAPINKTNIQSETFAFPGHTDYLAQELQGNALMLMVQGNLRVGLLTDHVPVNEVASHITTKLINDKVNTLIACLQQDFGIEKPKIAILGLNPHSGDNGVIGKEEIEIMQPAIQKLFQSGKMVFGPFAADGFFGSKQYQNFDAVLACYHDQGLVPFKTIAFGKGVNYTAGLSKIRTSPDHGTGFAIAGKNQADESSFREAIYLAKDTFNKRENYLNLTKNPLKISPFVESKYNQ